MNIEREHLDAETIAAWLDGGLDAKALAAAEAHASNCDRCQALLATTARTLPAEAVHGVDARAFGFWKWLAPLAAAAAAVTIWMVVPQDRLTRAPETASSVSDAEPSAAVPSPVAPIAPAVVPERAAKSAQPSGADARLTESRRDAASDMAAPAQLADAQEKKAVAGPMQDQKREAVREEIAAATAAPAPPPAAPAELARERPEGAALGAVAQSRLQKQAGPLQIVAPDTERRWRVLADMIEYSQDGGRTWVPVRLTAGDVITAGVSPSSQVCWFVGERGLVLLATEGTNFTRLPFPERVDLTAITASDARRATVTTADGRTFRTEDNGRNWRNP